ncbi:MAG: hypothetical protein KKA55_04760 [Proteobacteria bacterium]|nr:hypothetical protein [Pseudomonadota bacterium]MBU1594828.1 hypothetical protein [Pseudomonadota bacterium]
MAANREPIFIGSITGKITNFSAGTTATTEQVVFSGDATEATRVDELCVWTNDTANKDLLVCFHDGAISREAALVQVPLSSGNANAVAALNLLASGMMAAHVQADAAGNKFINLPPGWSIRAKFTADLTGGKWANLISRGGKY